MAKKITNPISCVVTETNGQHRVRGDYGVDSEGVKERRSLEFDLTPPTINDIHEQLVEAINAKEGTTGEPVPEVEPEPEPLPEP